MKKLQLVFQQTAERLDSYQGIALSMPRVAYYQRAFRRSRLVEVTPSAGC